MTMPLVCICIPTYNAAETVGETLESILTQTYSNLIIHISDNASTDDTLKVVGAFDDPRVHLHAHTTNVGGEGNFTRCLQIAEGKYTAIFHADDVYEPCIIEKQVSYLEQNVNVGSVFTEAVTIDENGIKSGYIGKVPEGEPERPLTFEILMKMMLLHRNFLVCPSVLVRTDIWKNDIKVWGDDLFDSASDIDVWLRLSQVAPLVVLNEPLMRYRISSAQFSERIRNRTERTDFFCVMDHYLSRNDVRSFLNQDDLRHYVWLERHEAVACAFNLLEVNRLNDAKVLLKGVVSLDAISAGFQTKLGRNTLLGGIFLHICLTTGLTSVALPVLRLLKQKITRRSCSVAE